ncbi:hypothetical protein BB561_001956 [Smittium simulii]|uniref:Major facilitator superfamily (MFS) profile domain-containing protein n=1 Tax=Smittium simulii TaxID=133385 RepID=A0A2T9YSC3_9FUNG|nr:hypothetical protein BB561_001956 [Smittium simulii]
MGRNTKSYIVAAIASVGGLLFGYDIGVMSNILIMDYFKAFFNNPTARDEGIIVSFLTLGCFFGSLISGQLCDRISRKRTIILGSFIFVCGSMVQGATTGRAMLVAGRFINGIAVGFLSQAVPTYQSELSSPEIRGRLISLQQWSITWGIFIAFWVAIATRKIQSNASWRISLYCQAIPAAILLFSMPFMPYSPRWLISKGRDEEGLKALAILRSGGDTSDALVIEEYEDIKHAIKLENEVSLKSYSELFVFPIRRRLTLGVLTQVLQQLTGINVIMYYAPAIFKQAGIGGNDAAALATGINGGINVLFTIPAILFVDRWGRRKTLIMGAIGCGLSYFILGLCIAIGGYNVIENGEKVVKMKNDGASYTAIVMVYTFVASFAISWGPVGWIYPAEIFPMAMRAKGTSITTAANWALNFIVGLISPVLMKSITWGLYMIFFAFMCIAVVTVYFFYPETKGRTLEQMEIIFRGSIWAVRDQKRIEDELAAASKSMA